MEVLEKLHPGAGVFICAFFLAFFVFFFWNLKDFVKFKRALKKNLKSISAIKEMSKLINFKKVWPSLTKIQARKSMGRSKKFSWVLSLFFRLAIKHKSKKIIPHLKSWAGTLSRKTRGRIWI